MSLYKSAKSPFYAYDFQIDSRRFHGSTKARNKKDAEAVERDLKAKAKADIEQQKKTGNGPLLLRHGTGRFWNEVGQHYQNAGDTFRDLERLNTYFGPDKRMDEITDADVAALVAWRRRDTVTRRKGKEKHVQLIAPATVNRTTIVPLRAVFSRGKKVWRYTFPLEPNWTGHWLKEPEERVRELDQPEGEALDAAVRDDYALWFEFARLTGLRRNETLIRWKNVNIFAKKITTTGKRGRKVHTPITPEVQVILDQCKGHHAEFVFTYVCRRPLEGQKKGTRYPITPAGAKTQWRRLRKQAKVEDFRFHDIRHDVATKVLRQTGNMKTVQKALNHANIATTAKYAHVLDEEVGNALSHVAQSRKKSQNDKKDVA